MELSTRLKRGINRAVTFFRSFVSQKTLLIPSIFSWGG